MKHCYHLFSFFFFTLLFASSVSLSQELKPVKLQLKWRHQFQFAGYYAAQIKGFYKDEQLEVKILPGGPGILPIDNVLNGKADFGVFDPTILLRNDRKKPLVVLATIMQSSPYVIISLKDKKILSPSDLIGRTILVQEDQGWSIFKAILLKEGINANSIKVIPRSKDSEEIIENKADAVVTYLTTQPQKLKGMGYEVNLIRPVEYGVDFYGDVLFSSLNNAYRDTEKTDAFIRASLKGWEYALKHEDEIIDYILTLPGVKEYGNNRKYLKIEAKELKKLIMPELIKVGHMNIGRWQYMLELYQQLGLADKSITLKNFIYNPKEKILRDWLMPAIYLLCGILLVIIIIVIINWQLRERVKIKTRELEAEILNRKRAENLANDSKEQIELILKSANIGLWEWDLKTNLKTYSEQLYGILGIKQDDLLIDFDPFDSIHPDDLEKAKQIFQQNLSGTRERELVEFRIKNSNDEYIHILSSSRITVENEQTVKISGIAIDIEKIKKKEIELLKISEELMQSNNELKKFAYITSHNLRGPVVNIVSLFQMIDLDKIDDENQVYIDKIGISVDKLDRTLNDLIEIVSHQKPENKSFTIIDFKVELDEIIQSIEMQIVTSKAKFNTNFLVKTMPYSKKYFESILLNLITNAIKYKSKDEPLILDISTTENEEYIILKVKDNGIGIDLEKNKTKIFGLYQRFEPNIEGKGIGLFIIKSHIETLGGKIEVNSDLGKGTTFIIYFAKNIN